MLQTNHAKDEGKRSREAPAAAPAAVTAAEEEGVVQIEGEGALKKSKRYGDSVFFFFFCF